MMMSINPSDIALSPSVAGAWKSAAPPRPEQSTVRELVPCKEPQRPNLFGRRRPARLLLGLLVDRNDLERRGVGFDAQRLARDQPDLVQRRLFEFAGAGLVHRVLPHAHRAPSDQHLGDAAGVFALELRKFVVCQPDHDFIPWCDDLEQRTLVAGDGGLNRSNLDYEAGEADSGQQP